MQLLHIIPGEYSHALSIFTPDSRVKRKYISLGEDGFIPTAGFAPY